MNLLAKFDNLFLCAILCVYMGEWTPFGLNTVTELIQGKSPDPVANLVGGFTHPGVAVDTTPVTGTNAPLNYGTPLNQMIQTGGAPLVQPSNTSTNTNTNTTKTTTPTTTPSVPGDSELQILAKTDRNPAQESRYQELLRQQRESQGPSDSEINAIYDPTMNYLNQAESAVRNDFPNVLDAAQKSYELAIQELTGSKNKNLTTIGENTLQAGNRKEDALSSARRLYDELRRGYSQRFGGSTSAGQAATELASVEQQRQMGATNRQYSDTVRQIDQQKVQLEQDYSLGQQKILESKNQALIQANRDFQNKILEIQGKRAETESAKAQAKLSALQELRNQSYQAQKDALTYQQNLDLFYKQQQADLTSYAQKLQLAGQGSSSAINSFLNGTTTNPTSTLQVGSSGGQNTTNNYTGIIGKKAEDLTGQMTNTVRQYNPQTGQYEYVTPDKARASGY